MDKATGKTPVITVDSSPSSDSSSNVSATPDHGDTACKLLVLANEAAKNQTKMVEEAGEIPGAADAHLLLDLTPVNAGLCLDDPLSSNKVKESSSSDNSARDEPPPANRVFSCAYCKKNFTSWQALGGHQNAHRLERLMVKRQQEMAAMNRHGPPSTRRYGYGGFNALYLNVPRFPAFGPLNRLAPPGMGMDQPMVQRVQPSWSQPGHPPMMASPPPRMDGMPYVPTNCNNNVNNGGFVGQFLPPPAFDHPQQGGGAVMHSFKGPSSIPSPNVPMNTVANGGGSSCGGGGSSGNRHVLPGKRDVRPKTDHGELDLTLKL
ncbi:zinc finger protein 8-like [Syzygium oleosum]|uniref:zinc finger protein 8-like n=1 Tax=Syzygium oleosum TaxID=219896 RepID=UPI0011D26813|nr:zinc finger protein 8-like [Syzygium oleosum]